MQVSVTGQSSDLILMGVTACAGAGFEPLLGKLILVDEPFDVDVDDDVVLLFHDPMLMIGFCDVCEARLVNFVTRVSNLATWRSRLVPFRRLGGRTFTASDSSLRRKAATTIFVNGCRHFRPKFRILFLSDAMHGGGFIAKMTFSTKVLSTRLTSNRFGRALIRCGPDPMVPKPPDEGNGDGIESLPPSDVAENIEINLSNLNSRQP